MLPSDVIEVGAPFTDPIADGPTIQTANTVRIYAAIVLSDRR